MTYLSFIILAFRVYSIPLDWGYKTVLLEHTFGILLITLHVWSSNSIYEVLGDFGWFYGDFFIDELKIKRGLSYTGIYRFLNNPEKVIGHAAFWGMALVCNSPILYALTLFGQISTWVFLDSVENPHMKKLYGSQIRPKAGSLNMVEKVGNGVIENVVKTFELESVIEKVRVMIPSSRFRRKNDQDDSKRNSNAVSERSNNETKDSISKIESNTSNNSNTNQSTKFSDTLEISGQIIEELLGEVERVVDTAFPTLQVLFEKVLTAKRDEEILSKIPKELYSIVVVNKAQTIGDKILVEYQVPVDYLGFDDWIGIYPLKANTRKSITFAKSKGRWMYINGTQTLDIDPSHLPEFLLNHRNQSLYGEANIEVVTIDNVEYAKGQLIFSGLNQPWKSGEYEVRFHFQGRHSVLAISDVFTITKCKSEALNPDTIAYKMRGFVQSIVSSKGNLGDFIELGFNNNFFEYFKSNASEMDASMNS